MTEIIQADMDLFIILTGHGEEVAEHIRAGEWWTEEVALIATYREQARLEGISMGREEAVAEIEALRYRINNPPLSEDDQKRLVRLRKMVAEFGPDEAVPNIMRPFLLPWREEWKAELADLEQRAARASQSDCNES